MTKDEALQVADGSVNELARMLGIRHSAVSQWSDEKIPELREYQIKEIIDKREAEQQPEEA
ncbi:MAG: Cro/CI family transcriptional regulator [Pseudomonadales bacterium]|uniref:Cro/CI family transcriptional regulator n=1 Tax=Psychrobacter sp. 1044 TaxID=2772562 RepID=UPI0019184EDD|nr:Cro/CI family transcriptional regulator [Psychrobacter sp. 1044]